MSEETNKGILYEQKINRILAKNKVQRKGFVPAGTNPNAPDAELRVGGKDYKVEIKLDLKVDFGQGSLDYDVENKKWILGGAKTPSAQQMREFLDSIGVLDIVKKHWGPKGPPRKFTVPLKFFKQSDVDYDYKKFKDIFVKIPSDSVTNYYNTKNTYYIQIGNFGLYYMGKDIANLGVPKLDLELKLRVRIKRGSSLPIYNYRFSTAILAVNGSLTKSEFDLEDEEFLKAIKARS